MTIRYRLRGQIIGVGITDAGVHFRTRRTDRLVPWEKFRPKPSTMDRGRGYVIEATNPKSWIGVCTPPKCRRRSKIASRVNGWSSLIRPRCRKRLPNRIGQ